MVGVVQCVHCGIGFDRRAENDSCDHLFGATQLVQCSHCHATFPLVHEESVSDQANGCAAYLRGEVGGLFDSYRLITGAYGSEFDLDTFLVLDPALQTISEGSVVCDECLARLRDEGRIVLLFNLLETLENAPRFDEFHAERNRTRFESVREHATA